jgi:hypothetical protein
MGYDSHSGVLLCGEGTHQSDSKLLVGKSYWVLLSVRHTSLVVVSLSPQLANRLELERINQTNHE